MGFFKGLVESHFKVDEIGRFAVWSKDVRKPMLGCRSLKVGEYLRGYEGVFSLWLILLASSVIFIMSFFMIVLAVSYRRDIGLFVAGVLGLLFSTGGIFSFFYRLKVKRKDKHPSTELST